MSSNPELHRARLEHLNSHHDPSYLNGQIKAPSDFPQTGSLGQGRALEERGGTSGIPDSFHGVGPAAGPSRNGMARENGFARPTLPLLANLQSKGQVSSAGMSAEQGSLVASSHENASGAASGLKDSSPQAQNGLSAKARGKARQVDQNIPMEVLEAELPVEDEGLVPLAHIIERMANYGYEALQNLGET